MFLSMKKKKKIIKEEYKLFRITVILNIKVTVIEIKHYQLKNNLMKLYHI